jgi:hypothetical protein
MALSPRPTNLVGTVPGESAWLTELATAVDALTAALAAAAAGTTILQAPVVAAVTATADGLTTGIIPATCNFAQVTSGNSAHICVLPTPVVGKKITINVGANGFQLRSSAPATVLLNGATGGAAVQSAIAANSTVIAECIGLLAWKTYFLDADSDLAKTAAAA